MEQMYMANILPETTATGSEPLILHLENALMDDGGESFTSFGTVKGEGNKTKGGLAYQAGESGVQWQVHGGNSGPNGYMWTAGLNNTDFSNSTFLGHFSWNAWNRCMISPKADEGLEFHLGSSVGNANVRHWCLGGMDTLVGQGVGRHVIVVDPSQAGTRADTGTFNVSSIDEKGTSCDTANSWDTGTYNWIYHSRFCKILKTKAGACGVYGTNASLSNCAYEAITKAWALIETSAGSFTINTPFKFGDGSTTLTNPDSNCVLTAPTPAKDSGDDRYHLMDTSLPFFCDPSGETVTFTNYTFNWGIPSLFDFDTDTASTWTWTGFSINNAGTFTIGADHDITGTASLASGSNVVLNGGEFHGTINGNVELTAATDLNDLTINGNLLVNINANTTLNFSNVVVTGTVQNDAGSRTLVIIPTGTSSLTASDPGTGNGQTDVQALGTIEVTNLVTGSRVRVTRDDTSAELFNGSESSGTISFTTDYAGAFTVTVRKASSAPYYIPYVSGGTSVIGLTVSVKALQQSDE